MLKQKFDQVPWTLQQTFLGMLISIVPWIVISSGLSFLNQAGNKVPTGPVPRELDLANAIVSFVLTTLIQLTFVIGPLYIARRSLREQGEETKLSALLRVLGFRPFKPTQAFLSVGLLFIGIILLNILYQYLVTVLNLHIQTNDQYILELGKKAPITVYALLFAAVVIAPICEETFFRGFIFAGFMRSMPINWAIILSSLIFAFAHADAGTFPVLFFIGMALAFLRWYTGSIWPGLMLHFLNNASSALLIILAMQGVIRG